MRSRLQSERLGGYVRMQVPDRLKAVAELSKEGLSNVKVAEVLGIDETTVRRDKGSASAEVEAEKPADQAESESDASANAEDAAAPAPPNLKAEAKAKTRKQRDLRAVAEPSKEGLSTRKIGEVLGVGKDTVHEDQRKTVGNPTPKPAKQAPAPEAAVGNPTPAPNLEAEAKTKTRKQRDLKAEAKREDKARREAVKR